MKYHDEDACCLMVMLYIHFYANNHGSWMKVRIVYIQLNNSSSIIALVDTLTDKTLCFLCDSNDGFEIMKISELRFIKKVIPSLYNKTTIKSDICLFYLRNNPLVYFLCTWLCQFTWDEIIIFFFLIGYLG